MAIKPRVIEWLVDYLVDLDEQNSTAWRTVQPSLKRLWAECKMIVMDLPSALPLRAPLDKTSEDLPLKGIILHNRPDPLMDHRTPNLPLEGHEGWKSTLFSGKIIYTSFVSAGTINSLIGNLVDLIDDYGCRRKQDMGLSKSQ